MNGFRIAVPRTGRPANRPAATAVAYLFGSLSVFWERKMMSFLRKFTLGLLVVCTLMALPLAGLASTAHTAVAAQAASRTLKVCAGDLCM